MHDDQPGGPSRRDKSSGSHRYHPFQVPRDRQVDSNSGGSVLTRKLENSAFEVQSVPVIYASLSSRPITFRPSV
jgi:hypothetical protein